MFYDKLFSSLDFTLPRAATGRRGFPKEAMVCAFIVMKCEGFTQITDLMDYLDNNRLIAHYCGFNIMEPLPSYWTYDRCLRQLNNGALKSIMANLVRKLYELGVVDALNESRFSNYFIEKWDLSYPRSLAIWGFPLFHVKAPILQNAPNAKLIFLCMAAI